jgi:DNA repair exonuclease SbcCD nuclease subunit
MAKAEERSKSYANQAIKAGKGPPPGADIADSGSVDKIRDILFGNQMRDFEKRFTQMEERLAKANQDLREETLKRLEVLELFFKRELDALKARLKSESDERTEGEKQLNDELKNASAALKKAIAQVEENFSEQATEIRRQILEQSKSLAAEIQSKNEQAAAELSTRASALDETKINRSTMAEYFIEMAMRLSNHSGDMPAVDRNE